MPEDLLLISRIKGLRSKNVHAQAGLQYRHRVEHGQLCPHFFCGVLGRMLFPLIFSKHLFSFQHFLPKISQSLCKTHATKAQTSKMHAILADLHDRQQSAPQFPSVLLTIDRHDLHMLVWVTHSLLVFFQERKPAKVREQETDGQGRA